MQNSNNTKGPLLGIVLIVAVLSFCTALFYFGDRLGFMNNTNCFKYMGCNAGFFGFDAFVHFISGIMVASFLLWIMKEKPKLNLLSDNIWKNILLIVALVVLVSVCWELIEFCHDHFNTIILHQTWRLHTTPPSLDQITNDDTMGDIFFSIAGAKLTLLFLWVCDKKSLLSK